MNQDAQPPSPQPEPAVSPPAPPAVEPAEAALDLLEAAEEMLEAQATLDNREGSGPNAEDYFVLLRRRNQARDRLEEVVAKAAPTLSASAGAQSTAAAQPLGAGKEQA